MTPSIHDAACVKNTAYGRVVSVQSKADGQLFTQMSGNTVRLESRHCPRVAVGVVATSTTTRVMSRNTMRAIDTPMTILIDPSC
jgi:hypothetical protein